MRYPVFASASLCLLLLPRLAAGVCPPSCPVPGGGDAATDCQAEFAAPALRLNFPFPTPPFEAGAPNPGREVRCFDGEPGCDTDGMVNGVCLFDIDVCLRNQDPALPSCTAADVTGVAVSGVESDADLAALQAGLDALLPATTSVCTTGQRLRVPASEPRGTKTVALTAQTSGRSDADELVLSCVPHGWPSHGYDHANTRASRTETGIGPHNAAQLRPVWQFNLTGSAGSPNKGVTSSPTVGNGLVYVSSWNGRLYALDPDTGAVRWTYEAVGGFGLQSSPTLTADGRVVIGDSVGVLHCVDATTGALLWKATLGNGTTDHMWASPTVANGRVFIGVASHSDVPCTQGRLFGVGLDTGELLWERKTVPDKICQSDTAVTCTTDEDCGGNPCIPGVGAGITATVAVDASGETVFMNTVGCFTSPSIGDSDAMFRLDAATGAVVWKNRVVPPEQFGACVNNQAIDCRTAADCGGAACQRKRLYHDFGFLNGPLLATVDDGAGGTRPLVVSGAKHGTLYAFNPDSGAIVWDHAVLPIPVTPFIAGYGLFNGAIAFAEQRIHAALYEMVPAANPPPDRLMAFGAGDGTPLWSDDIGASWSSVTVANGLVFAGNLATVSVCADDESVTCTSSADCGGGTCDERSPIFIYDAATGARLKEILLPAISVGGASTVDGRVYIPYGATGPEGGIVAFELPTCAADCNRDRRVGIEELTRSVAISLDSAPLTSCRSADDDGSERVTIDELIRGVDNALNGCE